MTTSNVSFANSNNPIKAHAILNQNVNHENLARIEPKKPAPTEAISHNNKSSLRSSQKYSPKHTLHSAQLFNKNLSKLDQLDLDYSKANHTDIDSRITIFEPSPPHPTKLPDREPSKNERKQRNKRLVQEVSDFNSAGKYYKTELPDKRRCIKKSVDTQLSKIIKNSDYKMAFESVFDVNNNDWLDKKTFSENGFCEMPPYSKDGLRNLKRFSYDFKTTSALNLSEHRECMTQFKEAVYYFTAKVLHSVLHNGDRLRLEEPVVDGKTRNGNSEYGFQQSPTSGAFLHTDIPKEKVTVILPGLGSGTQEAPTNSSTLALLPSSLEKIEQQPLAAQDNANKGVKYFQKKENSLLTEADFFRSSTQQDDDGNLWTKGILFCGGSENESKNNLKIKATIAKNKKLPSVIHTSPQIGRAHV